MIYSRRLPFHECGAPIGELVYNPSNFHWFHSATTHADAAAWILKNGAKIVEDMPSFEIRNETQFYTMFIKKMTSSDDYTPEDEDLYYSNKIDNIKSCEEPYTSFAFTKDVYDLLLKEHFKLFVMDWAEGLATSIVYVSSDGTVCYGGCDLPHFERCKKEYMSEHKSTFTDKYNEFCKKHAALPLLDAIAALSTSDK